MRTKLFAAAAIALGATAGLAAPAHATTAGECQVLIDDLIADTSSAASLATKNKTGLVGKAEDAGAKLDAGKLGDAHQKLTDYESTLDALHAAAKPKVSVDDHGVLSGDVDAALACVGAIEAP